MAEFSYNFRDVTGSNEKPITIIDMVGSVDPEGIDVFEGIFVRLIQEQRFHAILNFEKLKYINSTGMGMLVSRNDEFVKNEGQIVFMNVPPKVALLLEMLGLQELFKIVETEQEAVSILSGVNTETNETGKSGSANAGSSVIQEMNFQCSHCGANLTAINAGVYRCPRCRSIIKIETSGKAAAYPEPMDRTGELTIPLKSEFFNAATTLAQVVGRKAGLDGDALTNVGESVKLSLTTLEQAADKDSSVQLLVRAEDNKTTVRIFARGKSISAKAAFDGARGKVDEFQYANLPDGNLVTLIKRKS